MFIRRHLTILMILRRDDLRDNLRSFFSRIEGRNMRKLFIVFLLIIFNTIPVKAQDVIKYNERNYTIITDLSTVEIPKNFTLSSTKVNGKFYPCFKHMHADYYIVYLKSSQEHGYYVVQNGIIARPYTPVTVRGETYIPEDISKTNKEGMTYTTITINNVEMKGYVYNSKEKQNYSLVKLINEKGEEQQYLYEKSEGTLQKYIVPQTIIKHSHDAGFYLGMAILFAIGFVIMTIKYHHLQRKTYKYLKKLAKSKANHSKNK